MDDEDEYGLNLPRDDEDAEEYGEMVEMPGEEEPDVEDTEDGGAIVRLDDDEAACGGDSHEPRHIDGVAVQVHGYDRGGAVSDDGVELFEVETPGGTVRVGES